MERATRPRRPAPLRRDWSTYPAACARHAKTAGGPGSRRPERRRRNRSSPAGNARHTVLGSCARRPGRDDRADPPRRSAYACKSLMPALRADRPPGAVGNVVRQSDALPVRGQAGHDSSPSPCLIAVRDVRRRRRPERRRRRRRRSRRPSPCRDARDIATWATGSAPSARARLRPDAGAGLSVPRRRRRERRADDPLGASSPCPSDCGCSARSTRGCCGGTSASRCS